MNLLLEHTSRTESIKNLAEWHEMTYKQQNQSKKSRMTCDHISACFLMRIDPLVRFEQNIMIFENEPFAVPLKVELCTCMAQSVT